MFFDNVELLVCGKGKGVNVGPNLFIDANGTIVSPQMAELDNRLARCTAALAAVREVGASRLGGGARVGQMLEAAQQLQARLHTGEFFCG